MVSHNYDNLVDKVCRDVDAKQASILSMNFLHSLLLCSFTNVNIASADNTNLLLLHQCYQLQNIQRGVTLLDFSITLTLKKTLPYTTSKLLTKVNSHNISNANTKMNLICKQHICHRQKL